MARQDLKSDIIKGDIWIERGPRAALDEVYAHATRRALDAAAWYKEARVWKRRLGRGSRAAALGFVGLGGMIPFLGEPIALPGTALVLTISPLWSAAFFGLAAGCIALDRLFGWTSGWTRYSLTGFQIEHALDDFQLQWQADLAAWPDVEPTEAEVATQLQKLRAFTALVNGLIQAETEAWVAEFQAATQAVEGRIRRVEVK